MKAQCILPTLIKISLLCKNYITYFLITNYTRFLVYLIGRFFITFDFTWSVNNIYASEIFGLYRMLDILELWKSVPFVTVNTNGIPNILNELTESESKSNGIVLAFW